MTQSNVSNNNFSSNQHFNPQIYVACLASYNNGVLFGTWIDAAQDEECIKDEIQQMLSDSSIPNAEEWEIHSFDNFGSYQFSECASISDVQNIALFIKEHGELGTELVAHLGDFESARYALENNYHGEHHSELYFSMELFDECYIHEIPENIRLYINYESFSDDLFSSDYYWGLGSNGTVNPLKATNKITN